MKTLIKITAFCLLACPLWAQMVTIGSGSNIGAGTLICATGSTSTVATPTASPAAGTYSSTQSVILSTSTGGAAICYTTDGSTPTASAGTCTHGTTYSTAISVSTTQTIKAIGSLSGYTNSGILSAAYTITSSQVATPTFSTAAGAVSPGTTISGSTSTSGATIYYTLDGTTPGYDSYYMPTGTSHILGTAGTSGITAGNTFVPNFDPYGPMTIKMLAAKSGMTDSAVASASYTLTAATGTAVSSCETIASAGTYYLNSDVSSTGTCFSITAKNVTLNLNGHTISYGTTSETVLSGTDLTTTSGSKDVSCTSCTFTSGMVGDRFYGDNYNLGGYQNTGSSSQSSPTVISTFTDSHHVILSTNVSFTATGAEYYVTGPAVFGIYLNASNSGSAGSLKIYNGTITQSANASPDSHGIYSAEGGGSSVYDNITFNISQPEAEAIAIFYDPPGTYGDEVAYNTVNDDVTVIYNRDGLPYPFYFGAGEEDSNTPESIHDNVVNNSPQGGTVSSWAAYMVNNTYIFSGTAQYANGYADFASADNTVMRGNTMTGYTRGDEIEKGSVTMQNESENIVDSAEVQNPNHAATGCDPDGGGFGVRTKDYGTESGTPSCVDNLIDSNELYLHAGSCGARIIQFTILGTGDTTTISNNILTLDMDGEGGALPSSIYGADGGPDAAGQPSEWNGDASGLTYTDNTYSIVGAYASQGAAAAISYDGVANWTIGGMTSPLISFQPTDLSPGGINSSATFSGTGTATMECFSGISTITATYNGTPLTCP